MNVVRAAGLTIALGALVGAPAGSAASVRNGSPNLPSYRGKPVAVVFFHPF